ncbi:hypothetical protein GcM1_240023 [Golovinomyces cichoracearum]|uniref:Uncharacterized protein n=1 Tax=Golovinomyces cichoracearum TaxID=62708 RepID=A0A420II23_9PEZI|nr:hypothetical protein GcM1_240023 [Golovinomyces cichoracearum]
MADTIDTKNTTPVEISWDSEINPNTANPTELADYVTFKVKILNEEDVSDSNLWELFQNNFENFTVSTFSQVKLRTQQVLRDCLRSRGVHISKNNKRKTIAQTLFECLQEEDQYEWTNENIDDIPNDNYVVKSPKLARQIANQDSTLSDIAQPTSQKLAPLNIKQPTTAPPASLHMPSNTSLEMLDKEKIHVNPSPLISSNENLTGFGKEIANMAKIYTEEQKYGGTNESLDFKLKFFYDICSRADIPQKAYSNALQTLLKGLALDIYFMNELSNISFQNAIEHLRNYFQGPEFHRKNLSEWNITTLKTFIAKNPEKSIGECLLLLIKTLRKLQHGFREALQTIDYLHDKLVTACHGVPACIYAVSDPLPTIGALINKLQSSIIASIIDATKRCYVCHKEDCRSWNHSEQEWDNYKNKFNKKFKNRLRPRLFNNKHFQKRFKHYIMDCEGDHKDTSDDRSESELDNLFDSLVVDVVKNDVGTDANEKEAQIYCTNYGKIIIESATSMALKLSNKAFNNALNVKIIQWIFVYAVDSQIVSSD